MKDKIKKVFKSRIFLCILTALLTGTVSVYAVTYFPSNQVTYDNKTSGLKSSDVQGAIDELYNTCSSAAQSGDYVYYSVHNNYGSGISRMDLDGKNVVGIQSTTVSSSGTQVIYDSIYVTDDYVYYSVHSNYGSGISRMDLDGKNVVGIQSTTVSSSGTLVIYDSIYVTDDYIYYSTHNDYGAGISRMDLDGKNAVNIQSNLASSSGGLVIYDSIFIK